ncbi:hypothetical protein ABH935_006727 [Catenulispora sp. GAS73]|uniref:CU044_2847 family protein n=1 Tax=Catenulispora sp. GAS73 TaxID=3156269 RepID=UPI00351646BE
MGNYVTFDFDDGTSVLVEVVPAPEPDGRGAARGDLPEGTKAPVPITRAGDVAEKAEKTLTEVLKPLVPLLGSVHQVVSDAVEAPDEVTVQLALKLSSELKLVVVNSNGEASLTVTAKWALKKS